MNAFVEPSSKRLRSSAHDGIGASLPRLDDERLLRGGGRYVTDVIARSKADRVKVLRSPFAHARVTSIDASRALTRPGVLAVITGHDARDLAPVPCDWVPPGMTQVPEQTVLASDRVRYVGEPVAAIVASSAAAAAEALEYVDVTYEVLPAVANQEAAMAAGAPNLHEGVPDNVAHRYEQSAGDTARAFAEADVTSSRRFVNNRVAPAPLEGRAVLSDYDGVTGKLTHWSSSQRPHFHAQALSRSTGIPLHRLRFLTPDVGGGFGAKLGFYPEDVLCALLSMRTGRPCAWIEGREEAFLATTHGRDHVQYVELAAGRDGVVTGMRCRLVADLGAYAFGMGPGVPPYNAGVSVTGQYRIPNVEVEVVGVFTNRTPTGPYRGAGHPEATFAIERALDELSFSFGMDPAEIRRVNYVAPREMPHKLFSGLTLDSGDYAANFEAALRLGDYQGLLTWRDEARARGRLVGVGLATFAEGSSVGPSSGTKASGFRHAGHESARVVVHADGTATVFSGTQDSGQGHGTSLAQIAAQTLGLAPEAIALLQGDTRAVPFGTGSFNSRTMAVGGSAVHLASERLLEKIRRIAAHILQRTAEDLEYQAGTFRVRGSGEGVTFAEVARVAHLGQDLPVETPPGLDESATFEPSGMAFSYGAVIAAVEVDEETGHVALLRFVMADDCGRLINPMLAEGQAHGGAAQGIGQALMEAVPYGGSGEVLVAGFDDYALPHADDLPAVEMSHTETPSPLNPLGAKGAGEGATIGSTPAVANAVIDALRALGVQDVTMPMTPMNVRRAIEAAQRRTGRV